MHSQRLYPHADRHAAAWVFTLGVVFGLAVLVSAGCIPAEAIEQARTEQAINQGHANSTDITEKARLVGQDNWDAWSAQRYALEGKRLPEEVEERLRERGTLPEGYDK